MTDVLDEPASFVHPTPELEQRAAAGRLRLRVSGIFGGPGSGPRPGFKRPKKPSASPISAPANAAEPQGGSYRLTADTAAALDRSTDQWCSMVGFTSDEIDADWRAETNGPREQLKIRAGAAIAARIEQDPEWIAHQAESTVQYDPLSVADAYIQQWATTAADGSAESHAIQRAAAEVFGAPRDVGASSMHGLTPEKVDAIYESDGWAMRSFVRATYAETQAALKAEGITEMTLARGFDDRQGNSNVPPDTREIVMNPLSSWATSLHAAQEFTGGNGRFFVATVPAERIVAIPATGPGCASEYEVIVMGGPAQAATLPAFDTIVPNREASMSMSDVTYIDEPPNDDWPKRTDDLIGARSELATFGGPGSGPRPGYKRNPILSKAVAPDGTPANGGQFGRAFETILMDKAAEQIAEILGVDPIVTRISGGGRSTTTPIDIALGDLETPGEHFAGEVKTQHVDKAEYKVSISAEALLRKLEAAAETGAVPVTFLQVVDQDARRVSVHMLTGEFKSFRAGTPTNQTREPALTYTYTEAQYRKAYDDAG